MITIASSPPFGEFIRARSDRGLPAAGRRPDRRRRPLRGATRARAAPRRDRDANRRCGRGRADRRAHRRLRRRLHVRGDRERRGSHAIIGAEFIKRYGESEDVVNGVASHHDEVPHTNVLGILVSAADAISASRPGARSETMTTYINRLENLEKIGLSFPGVDKCFAVQAGRELRVVVQPDQIDDDQAFVLARNIARKIEENLQYPGQIRVTVVRETRCVEFAK